MELKEGHKMTEVGVIPEDWGFEEIEKYSKRGSGHTPSKKNAKYYNEEIVWISLADSNRLDKGLIFDSQINISSLGLKNSSAVLLPKGTVILSRDAGVGKSAIAGCELCVSQHFIAWTCNERHLHNWFLYFWLQFQKNEFERIAIGSTIKTIGLPYFKKYRIPLPPFSEQTAIATALSDMDALITSLEQLIAKKRSIKQGVMQELLTGKSRLPGFGGEWKIFQIGDLSIKVGSGITPTGGERVYKKEGRPFIRSQNVGWGKLILDDIAYIDDETHNGFSATEILENDIFLNITGASIGRCTIADSRVLKGNVNQHVCIIRVNPSQVIPLYLSYFLLSTLGQNQILNFQAGGNRQGLNFGQIRSITISLPPTILEQQEIATILFDLDTEITALTQKLTKLQLLKQGMMQNLLTGKIRLI